MLAISLLLHIHSLSLSLSLLVCGIIKTGVFVPSDKCIGYHPGFHLPFITLINSFLSIISYRYFWILFIVSLLLSSILIHFSLLFSDGTVGMKCKWKSGNSSWDEQGGVVMMEVSMSATPRSLRFFVDGKQQPLSFINIPDSIQFAVSLRILSLFLPLYLLLSLSL
jgi:hypothetical protein